MKFSTIRWATPLVTAALLALPGAAIAQSTPPTQSTPPAPQTAAPAPSGQVDANAAKQHLTEARDTLSQITSMPEAGRLQGDTRTQVSQLISNFNALITSQADWRAAYAKVDENLNTLIGPEGSEQPGASATGTTGTAGAAGTAGTSGTTGATGATGTTGSAAGAASIDPAIRAKLVEFRMHLREFEKAAGGAAGTPATTTAPPPSGAMPPSAATGTTANPANPAVSGTGATSNPTGSDVTKPNPPSSMSGEANPASPSSATASSAEQNSNAAAQSELAAIDAILKKSRTGALTKTQTAEIRRHVEALRALLNQK